MTQNEIDKMLAAKFLADRKTRSAITRRSHYKTLGKAVPETINSGFYSSIVLPTRLNVIERQNLFTILYGLGLTKKQRAVIDYEYNEQLSLEEVATKLGITQPTISKTWNGATSTKYPGRIHGGIYNKYLIATQKAPFEMIHEKLTSITEALIELSNTISTIRNNK